MLCCLRALLGGREAFGWWLLHGSRGRCGRRFAGLDGRGRGVDFSIALKSLPVGGKGGVDEPGGRGLVAFEICERSLILNQGAIVADDTTVKILRNEKLLADNRLELPKGFAI